MKTIITLFAVTAAFASAETPAKEAPVATKTVEKCCAKDGSGTIVLSGQNASKGTVNVQGGTKEPATPAKTDAKSGTIISSGTMVVNGVPTTFTIKPCDKGCVPPPATGKSCCDAAPAAATDKAEEKKEVEKK